MTKTLLLGAAAALALSGSAFAAHAPTLSVKSAHTSRIVFPHAGAKVIYDQNDNDNGVGIVSQNFEASFDIYDSAGADDFSIKKAAKVSEVDASGIYFNGSGPADSYNVTFYSGKKSPGKVVATCANASYTDTGFGSPNIKCKAALKKKGKYWVSVQVNMSFGTGQGEWGWNTNNTVRGNPAVWENPGNGFSTGCTTWGNMQSCLGSAGEGGDFAFAILGK